MKSSKSTMQVNLEKSYLIINLITDLVKKEDIQYRLVTEFYKIYHNGDLEFAYDLINEAFNKNLIAGYKYIECCDLLERKGEFREVALKNPLINFLD